MFVLPSLVGLSKPSGGGVPAQPAGTVTLSGETIAYARNSATTSIVYAGVRINTDGTIDKRGFKSGTYSQIDSGTDWIIPNGDANEYFEVYCQVNSESGAGLASSASLEGVWLPLTSNRLWYVAKSGADGTDTANITISIRYNGGATIDSAVYALSAQKFTI